MKRLFILWGSAGREVQVTRGGGALSVVFPINLPKALVSPQGTWPQSSVTEVQIETARALSA